MKKVVLILFFWNVVVTCIAQTIDKAEYFIDADPGVGAGVDIPVPVGVVLEDISLDISMEAVSDGFHYLFVRVRNADGRWSPAEGKAFFKETISILPALPDIVKVEYFIDEDPGLGNGIDVAVPPSTDISDHSFNIDLSGREEGEHRIFIRAKDANDHWSIVAAESFVVCSQPAPVAQDATAITTTGFVAQWSKVDGITDYELDVSMDGFGTFVSGYEGMAISHPDATVTDLSPGTEYQFRVRAKGMCSSLPSNAVSVVTRLEVPLVGDPFGVSSSSFTLSWSQVVNATRYRLDLSTDNFETFVPGFEDYPTEENSFTALGLEAGTTYYYRLRAENAVAVSDYSQAGSVITVPNAPAPGEPDEVSFTSFSVNWAPVTGATTYELDVSKDQFATFLPGYDAFETDATSVVVGNLEGSTEYHYRLRAVNDAGASENSAAKSVTTLSKQNQTIDFPPIDDAVVGAESFSLNATASSGLEVMFESSSTHIILSGNTVSVIGPGTVTIRASQPGDGRYLPAEEIARTFCVNPAKPLISISDEYTDAPVLTSNYATGNQWYRNGAPLAGEESQRLTVSEPGIYSTRTTIEGCQSELANDFLIIVTALEETYNGFCIYPNPAADLLYVAGFDDEVTIALSDPIGRTFWPEKSKEKNGYRLDIGFLKAGSYVVIVRKGIRVYTTKLIKK